MFRESAENEKYSAQIGSSAGVAVFVADHAHINQPVEVPEVRRDFARRLGASDARPDLVVRFGYAAPLPMSLRRKAHIAG